VRGAVNLCIGGYVPGGAEAVGDNLLAYDIVCGDPSSSSYALSFSLQSTRKKAKVPVSSPPPNSIDSDVEAEETSDPHLSQSATDIGVQIKLPEGETEMTPRGLKGNTGKPATNEDVREAPVAPGIVLTPRIPSADVESRVVISTEADKEITIVEELSATGTGVATGKAKLTESQRMLK